MRSNRCCQHNVSHGWPYYAEELWLATADGGVCASLYAASEVSAKVAGGTSVKIAEETDYPFSDTVTLKFSTTQPVNPAIPAHSPLVHGRVGKGQRQSGAVRRQAADVCGDGARVKDGDTVSLRLPMRVSIQKWEKNHDAVSVNYGPLTFSLKIGERWARCGGTDAWPELEVFPTTALELWPDAQ